VKLPGSLSPDELTLTFGDREPLDTSLASSQEKAVLTTFVQHEHHTLRRWLAACDRGREYPVLVEWCPPRRPVTKL
jgi:hypothetical protein